MANTDGKITCTTSFSTTSINISQKESPLSEIKQCFKFWKVKIFNSNNKDSNKDNGNDSNNKNTATTASTDGDNSTATTDLTANSTNGNINSTNSDLTASGSSKSNKDLSNDRNLVARSQLPDIGPLYSPIQTFPNYNEPAKVNIYRSALIEYLSSEDERLIFGSCGVIYNALKNDSN